MNIDRNSPCPCGGVDLNGKRLKYKKCCLITDEMNAQAQAIKEEQEFQTWFAKDLELGQKHLKEAEAV